MNFSYLNTRFVAPLILAILSMLLMNSVGVALTSTGQASTGQDADKSLDIERYADEPLELVELKIGDQPIKDKIATKFRLNSQGVDTVSFKQRDGWFRHLQIRMRNVSGKPIYGVRAHLRFRPSGTDNIYSVPLAGFTQLRQGVLEPNADITLSVTEQAWGLTEDIRKQFGVNPDLTPVSFGIDIVQFSDLQWSKGHMLRRDPEHPNRWIPIDKVVPG